MRRKRRGGATCTKATITSWTVPRAQWLECVCKMMWERTFAKQREGRWRRVGIRMIAFAQ